jgi:hypothetical protein
MSRFRLREYGVTGGPVTLPRVYATVDEACTVAERILELLAPKPHRRPHMVQVIDVWTGEIVTRVTPYTDRVDGVCVACGQPLDPFGGATLVAASSPPSGGAAPIPDLAAGDTPVSGPTENTLLQKRGLSGPAGDPSRLQVRPARRVVDG